MTNVKKDQFEWNGEQLTHKPTGALFYKNSQFMNFGDSGSTLPDGTCYEQEDVFRIANELVIAAKLSDNPS